MLRLIGDHIGQHHRSLPVHDWLHIHSPLGSSSASESCMIITSTAARTASTPCSVYHHSSSPTKMWSCLPLHSQMSTQGRRRVRSWRVARMAMRGLGSKCWEMVYSGSEQRELRRSWGRTTGASNRRWFGYLTRHAYSSKLSPELCVR